MNCMRTKKVVFAQMFNTKLSRSIFVTAVVTVICLLFGISCDNADNNGNTISEQETAPEVIDIENSGCMNTTRSGNESRVLVLTKEGDIISCEVQGYYANCGVRSFDIESEYLKGEHAPDSIFVDIKPVIPAQMNCTCPYNVYFTIRNVKADSFFLYCWLYSGMVSFKESSQVILNISSQQVTIDGSQYIIYKPGQQSMLYRMGTDESELQVPSTISYEGQDYSVASLFEQSLSGKETTRLILPKTIRKIDEDNAEFTNLFCYAFPKLEEIEVEPGCRMFSSVDGVLYSGDGKCLYCLPAGIRQTDYTVMDGVERIGHYAFEKCENLKSIRIPESVTSIGFSAFGFCKNLESIYILGKLNRGADENRRVFESMSSTPTIYVPESEVGFIKTLYHGSVLPLSQSSNQ